jgi:CheY-like chemotaxis protein
MARILIVEDEPRVAEVIADALRQLNHEPRVAETAGDALMMAEMERRTSSFWTSGFLTPPEYRRWTACAKCGRMSRSL